MNCRRFLQSMEAKWLVKNMEHLNDLYRQTTEIHPCECASCAELKEAIAGVQKNCEEIYARLVEPQDAGKL